MAPAWIELANDLKGEVVIAEIDATTNEALSKKFEVSGFPTLVYYPPGPKKMADFVKYEGGSRDFSALKSYLET